MAEKIAGPTESDKGRVYMHNTTMLFLSKCTCVCICLCVDTYV